MFDFLRYQFLLLKYYVLFMPIFFVFGSRIYSTDIEFFNLFNDILSLLLF